MKEIILKFEKSKIKGKKYTAYVKDKKTKKIRKIHFGASDYPQYKDRTPLKIYLTKIIILENVCKIIFLDIQEQKIEHSYKIRKKIKRLL